MSLRTCAPQAANGPPYTLLFVFHQVSAVAHRRLYADLRLYTAELVARPGTCVGLEIHHC